MNTASRIVILGALAFAQPVRSETILVEDVLIQLIEEVNVPARHAGVWVEVNVQEGQAVRRGDVIARMDDRDLQLDRDRTLLELDIATKNASNDIRVRLARKSLEVAEAELRRAMESVETYAKSISESEIDRSRLTVQRAGLEVEQAMHERAIVDTTRQLKETELRSVEHQLEFRKIVSPLHGVVAEVDAQPGEWVMPGKRVVRILRMDKLRAQGFLQAEEMSGPLPDRQATLQITLAPGKELQVAARIVFVSDEVDPVDGQVLVWADFDNPDGLIHPGMRARLQIHELQASDVPNLPVPR